MIHQPWGGAQGTASDIQIQAEEIGRLKLYLNQRLADHTGKNVKTIEKALTTPGWISVSTLELNPDWDPIRTDPRFQELLKMHGGAE